MGLMIHKDGLLFSCFRVESVFYEVSAERAIKLFQR
jgi:hypothetical protein